MNESYSNAILARCKGQGNERAEECLERGPTPIFAKHNKKAAVPLRGSLLQEQFACGSQFFALDRVDLRIG
jgi:hypothetical protein